VVALVWDIDAVRSIFPPILAARDAIFPASFAVVLSLIVVIMITT
jgi:hypothetical protein